MAERRVTITTNDNPYDPFDQFDDWYMYDIQKGYGTWEYVARLANTSDDLTDKENDQEIERAIDVIIKNDLFGIYKKVVRNQ